MNMHISRRLGPPLVALMLAVVMTACESPTAVEQTASETAELSAQLTQELSLSSSQQDNLASSMKDGESFTKEPGMLWYIAAALQKTLTEEQKERLFARTGDFEGPGRFRGFGEFQGPRHGEGGPGSLFDDLLTDEQKDAIETIRATYKDQITALIDAKRNGELAEDAFREQMTALRDAMKAEIDALLTDEQKATIEERKAERAAAREAMRDQFEANREARMAASRAAMSDALVLTADQETAVFAALDDYRAAREALRAQLEDGTLDPETLRDALATLGEAHAQTMQDILDDTQWEIVQIHNALAARAGNIARRRGPRGSGPGGPGHGG